MKKLFAVFMMMSFLFVAALTHAGEFGDLKKKISDARDSLVVMVKNKDKRGADQQKLVKNTADAVSTALSKTKAPAGKEAKFKELVETWFAFKNTREKELVPALLAGKQEDAEKIAAGVQKERMAKLNALCDELDK
jgi:hypothetical protein